MDTGERDDVGYTVRSALPGGRETNVAPLHDKQPAPFEAIRSRNPQLQRIVDYAKMVAKTPYSVLIEGETGTGKDLFARGIHAASGRMGDFVPINCSAVPDSMFEAELFGARRGAYTGAEDDRDGLFCVANGGTLFLDEVGDLPPRMQAKLLRVLEDGVIRPIGGATSIHVDVRVVAATHKRLKPLVDQGLFRNDLYFRLSATSLILPPIRERPEDLEALVHEALVEARALQGLDGIGAIDAVDRIDKAALAILLAYSWPGNVRELKNVVAGAVLKCSGEVLHLEDLPDNLRQLGEARVRDASGRPFFEALASFEREYMVRLLERAEGNLSRAARLSGLSRGTVRNKARQYGLRDSSSPVRRSRVRRR